MLPPLVVGLGRVGVSISGLGPNLPVSAAPAAELASLATTPAPGVAVALRAAAKLGCRARAAGSHGGDLLGALVRSALRDAGIDVELLRPGGTSACEIVLVAGDGSLRARAAGDDGDLFAGDRTAPIFGGAAAATASAQPGDLDPVQLMADAAALLLDATLPTVALRVAQHARTMKLPVILDVGELGEGTRELIAAADILILSERAASDLAPRGELPDALAQIKALGPRAVVITLGSAGAIGLHGEQVVKCPAFPSDALDVSGAGSVFHGAFAAALLSGLQFARCIELAAAAAALSLRELGPWSAMPTREDVLALVKTRRPA
jgi:ribokinase